MTNLMRPLFGTLLLFFSCSLVAQRSGAGSTKTNHFVAVTTIQNKGISTIPNLSLGKPAIILDMKLGRKLTLEPQIRYSLASGKPWAMVFWLRYYESFGDKLKITFHVNHSLSYKAIETYNVEGTPQDLIRTNRYMVGALSPTYQINKYLGIGAYLFYARGLEINMIRNSFMASFRPSFSNIPVARGIVARITPEIYELRMDGSDGLFFNARFLISKKDCPFALSGLVNKPIRSNIPSEHDLLWNVGVSYTFSRQYVEKQ